MSKSSGRNSGKWFPIRAELVDSDGVRVAHTEHGVIKARHKPVHPAGTPVTIPFTATIPSLKLTAGQRYQWRVSIDDEMHEDWLAGFTVTEGDAEDMAMVELEVLQADVTKLDVDAITNAANTALRHGGGV